MRTDPDRKTDPQGLAVQNISSGSTEPGASKHPQKRRLFCPLPRIPLPVFLLFSLCKIRKKQTDKDVNANEFL